MFKKSSLISIFFSFFLASLGICAPFELGTWRFELNAPYGDIPFLIEFKEKDSKILGVLKNGKESIALDEMSVDKNKIRIPLQTYEMAIEMNLPKEGRMTGFLLRENKNPVLRTPLSATYNVKKRFFIEKQERPAELGGRWRIKLEDEQGQISDGILLLEQKDENISGSLLTPVGDYRYFEGYVSGNHFEVASFDGVYNYIIKGELKKNKLEGRVLSNSITKFSGTLDANAKLPNAYSQTKLEKGLSFSFPNLEGKKISLSDKNYQGKPVIIQFFGSWCPNCLDETKYLSPWYEKNKKRGIEVVALAFERSLGAKEALVQLKKTQKKMNISYPLLIGGSTSEDKPKDLIPGLVNFISFPTTVFLDKKHNVHKVHAGFNGPGTGEFYTQWIQEFEQTVDELLK